MLDMEKVAQREEETGHSMFGASSLPRIVICPASVQESLKNPPSPDTIYSIKGSKMHGYIESALRSNKPKDYIYTLKLPIDDTSYLLDCLDYIDTLPKADKSFIEVKGSLEDWDLPEVWGTADYVQIKGKRLDVVDWKFGTGVPVHAKDNYQLIAYLGMALATIDVSVDDMYVHIAQPPLGTFESWQVSPRLLQQLILGDITDAVMNAKTTAPRYNPSHKACIFCGGKHTCKARRENLKKATTAILKQAENLTPEAKENKEFWVKFLEQSATIKKAISEVEKYAISELKAGRPFGSFKLVEGRAVRKFIDEEAGKQFIINRLEDKAWKPREVISLAQAEKIDRTLKKDQDWLNLIYKPQGKLVLADKNDKRPAVFLSNSATMKKIAMDEGLV